MAGNANSGKRLEKIFRDALRYEIARLEGDRKGLQKVARKLIEMAEDGNIQAIKELGDRVDGKVAQQINHADNAGEGPVQFLYKTIYEPKPPEVEQSGEIGAAGHC